MTTLLVIGVVAAVGFLIVLLRVMSNVTFNSAIGDGGAGDLPPGGDSAPDVRVTGTPGRLSASDIALYASNAGFTGDDLVTAVAVALAESSGKPGAIGDLQIVKPHGSVGLWQINTNAHPEYDYRQLTDPQYNANAAYDVYAAAGKTFRPWTTFKTSAYLAHLNDAFKAVSA